MMPRYFLGFLCINQALADLTCADYMPTNWTTPFARVWAWDPNSNLYPGLDPTTLPAYISATNPLHLAPNGSLGGLFHIKTCNSTSLNLFSTAQTNVTKCEKPYASYCHKDGQESTKDPRSENSRICNYCCGEYFNDNLQVIHVDTGHCLTYFAANHTSATNYNYAFRPCNPDPKDLSQIFPSVRSLYHYTDWSGNTYGVCDWSPEIDLYPQYPNDGGPFKELLVDNDNKTLVSKANNSPRYVQLSAEPHDALAANHQRGSLRKYNRGPHQ